MKHFYAGTALCILTAISVLAVLLFDLPKTVLIASIAILFVGFGLQLMGLWKVRPSVTLPEPTVKTINPKRRTNAFDAPRVIGVLLALLGSLGAVAVGVYITHSAGYLWALILVALVVGEVSTTRAEYTWKPTVLGAVMGLLCAGLATVIWYVGDATYLWALILIGFLTDAVI